MTIAELLTYGGVLLAALTLQLVVVQAVFHLRQGWRRHRGLPPVDTAPKVDPFTWGRLTPRGRAGDLHDWQPVGDPSRYLRSAPDRRGRAARAGSTSADG